MRCAPRASNGPNHLGLCALQTQLEQDILVAQDDLIGSIRLNPEYIWRLNNSHAASVRGDGGHSHSTKVSHGASADHFLLNGMSSPRTAEAVQPSEAGSSGSGTPRSGAGTPSSERYDSTKEELLRSSGKLAAAENAAGPDPVPLDALCAMLDDCDGELDPQKRRAMLTVGMLGMLQSLGLAPPGELPANASVRGLEAYLGRIGCRLSEFQATRRQQDGGSLNLQSWMHFFTNAALKAGLHIDMAQPALQNQENSHSRNHDGHESPTSAAARADSVSPPPSWECNLCLDVGGDPIYMRGDGSVLNEQPPDFVGDTVNTELGVCWCVDVWCDLVRSEPSMSCWPRSSGEGRTPRIHLRMIYESETCPPLQEANRQVVNDHCFHKLATTMAGAMQCVHAPADRARVWWHLDTMVRKVFTVVAERNEDGKNMCTPHRIWKIMSLAGEEMSPDELSDFFGEALYQSGAGFTVNLLDAQLDLHAFRKVLCKDRVNAPPGPLKAGRRFRSEYTDEQVHNYLKREDERQAQKTSQAQAQKTKGKGTDSKRGMGLPEWALDALESHPSYAPLEPDLRNGNEFWKLLVKKLENSLLVANWAAKDVEMLDRAHRRTDGDGSDNRCINRICTRDPEGTFANTWNIIQIFLLVYVCFSVPYSVGFDFSYEAHSFGYHFEMIVDVCTLTIIPSLFALRTRVNPS